MNSIKETVERLRLLMDNVKDVVFPMYSAVHTEYAVRNIRDIVTSLASSEIAAQFVDGLLCIKELVCSDVEAIGKNDPAAVDQREIVYCYPAVTALLHYRSAHLLYRLGVPLIPRMLTELAHAQTGIDIHPAAQIGAGLAIDHGTGIVIGSTAVIGNNCALYQGVTLGAKNFVYDECGLPRDIPRHPHLEDDVTVYSNATVLGNITIGEGSVIGGNVWLTHSVPPHSRILQGSAVESFTDGAGI